MKWLPLLIIFFQIFNVVGVASRNGNIQTGEIQDFADAFPPGDQNNPARTARYFDTFRDSTLPETDLNTVVNVLDGLLETKNAALVENAFKSISPGQYADLPDVSLLHNQLVSTSVRTQLQYLKQNSWTENGIHNPKGELCKLTSNRFTAFQSRVGDNLLRGFRISEMAPKNKVERKSGFLVLKEESKTIRPGKQIISIGNSTLWVQTYGQIGKTRGRHGNPRFRSKTGGISFGGDHEISSNAIVGALAGLATTPYNWAKGHGKGHMNSYYGGAYGTWVNCAFYVDAHIIAGLNHFRSQRTISFSSIQRISKESHNEKDITGGMETGYVWILKYFAFQPFVNVSYELSHIKGFKEHGAQSLNFKIKSRTVQTLRSEAGAEIYQNFIYNDLFLRPALGISWVGERLMSHHSSRMRGGLSGEPQSLILRHGPQIRNQISPGGGLTVQFGNGLYVAATVTAQLGSGQKLGDALLRIGYEF
ncbi:MAG: autotransporter outer membrane beta-barrel domain-containing protein [Alphaproteobacteria bacterium]|nr:autotransporter outer membrane beta-barrel domain-containing protein [Alphaproteobacteria bacterium]